jgi:hypothetical protein
VLSGARQQFETAHSNWDNSYGLAARPVASLPHDINRNHLAQTLSQFTELWDVLYSDERSRLVRSLIQLVTYHSASRSMRFEFAAPKIRE